MAQYTVRQSREFAQWLLRLRDEVGAARITRRVEQLALGAIGDVRSVGEGVRELRIDHGPGYRVYFVQPAEFLIVLLAAGDKDSQQRDIRRAKAMAANLEP
jgi:putative addiction module killer protein